jgi:hypothetical protein
MANKRFETVAVTTSTTQLRTAPGGAVHSTCTTSGAGSLRWKRMAVWSKSTRWPPVSAATNAGSGSASGSPVGLPQLVIHWAARSAMMMTGLAAGAAAAVAVAAEAAVAAVVVVAEAEAVAAAVLWRGL